MDMTHLFLLLLTRLALKQAPAQDCQSMTLAKLRTLYQAANRANSLLTEGFALPVLKADYSMVYHRCRKSVGYPDTLQPISLPELVQVQERQRRIGFTTYDRTTYLSIQYNAQQAYQVLSSLKRQAALYSRGYTDGQTAYLFDSVSVNNGRGVTQFRIALMPLAQLR